jgi:hypothetical protein
MRLINDIFQPVFACWPCSETFPRRSVGTKCRLQCGNKFAEIHILLPGRNICPILSLYDLKIGGRGDKFCLFLRPGPNYPAFSSSNFTNFLFFERSANIIAMFFVLSASAAPAPSKRSIIFMSFLMTAIIRVVRPNESVPFTFTPSVISPLDTTITKKYGAHQGRMTGSIYCIHIFTLCN